MDDEIAPLKMVEIKPPGQRQVDDDWFVLLDVAPKASGIYRVDFTIGWNHIETVMLKTEDLLFILHQQPWDNVSNLMSNQLNGFQP